MDQGENSNTEFMDTPIQKNTNFSIIFITEIGEIVLPGGRLVIQTTKIVFWEDKGAWLGYLQDYPDYWTQVESLDNSREHLKDLYIGITSSEISGIRC